MQGTKFVYRSVFWPIMMIGVGLIIFMGNMDMLPGFDWRRLAALWPLLLVGVGLDLIIGRRNVWVSALVGVATLGAAVAMLIYAPTIGIFQGGDVKTYNFSEPIGGATSAKVHLDLSSESARVKALGDSTTLFQADITHAGPMQFSAAGSGSEKSISLAASGPINWFFVLPIMEKEWAIGLTTQIPLALTVDVSAGSATLDLAGVQLTSLEVDGGAGSCTLNLPAVSKAYSVNYRGSAGSAQINIPSDADLTLRLDGSAGSINVRLASNSAVRVEVLDSGMGGVNLPAGMRKVSGTDQKKGVWETEGYASAAHKISIVVADVSAGSINIR